MEEEKKISQEDTAEEIIKEESCDETNDGKNEECCREKDKKECKKAEIKKLKAEIAEAEKKIGELNAKNAEILDMYKRLAAEFDNYKKRTAKEMDSRYQDAKIDTVKKILPVADNFERALKVEVPEDCKQFTQGVEMTFNQLKEIMESMGVKEIEALGKTFDPNFHNAVLHTEDESAGENVVVEVFEKGYTLGDKVLRYSTVRVAN